MVAKGKFQRFIKEKKAADRRDKSLCVKIGKRNGELEKPVLEALVMAIHSGIEKVYFPRQKNPKFFFLLCKSAKLKEKVRQKVKNFKNDDIGFLIPKDVHVREPTKIPAQKQNLKRTFDKKTIVLEAIPSSLETETIRNAYSNCIKINRFNARRCYLHFSCEADAMNAYERLCTEKVGGSLLKAKFIMSKTSNDSIAESSESETPESDVE